MRIVLYTGYQSLHWNPNTIYETGLGGTEQCVLFLAEEFAKLNHQVYVVGDVIEGDYPIKFTKNKVKYRTLSNFKSEIGSKSIDWIIATSYIHYLLAFEGTNYKHSAFWVHNTDFYPWWEGKELPNGGKDLLLHNKLDYIICLTEWHRKKFQRQFPKAKDKIKVIGNGLSFRDILSSKSEEDPIVSSIDKLPLKNLDTPIASLKEYKKIPNSFIYTSHAERGLAKVLEDWPSIKEKYPNALLRISTPEYGLKYFEENFEDWINNLDDVEFFGTLSRLELYDLMKTSEYWYYPSDYEETFCITALEMLAHMVKPITYEKAGLKETLHGFNAKNIEDKVDLHAGIYWAWRNRWTLKALEWEKLLTKHVMIDFAYILTIEDNHEHIQNKLSKVGIPNEWRFWIKDGFNAKDFQPDTYLKYGVKKCPTWKIDHSVDWYTREVTDGEVGCALSHIDAWVDSYKDEREATLILEDDFEFEFPVPWDEVNQLIQEGFDLIYLGRYQVNTAIDEDPIPNHSGWVYPNYSYNTHAYVLSKRGTELLVDHWIEKYKQNLIPLDEFFSILIGKTQREDILEIFKDLPKLNIAAPVINYVKQETNRNSTEYNSEYSIVNPLPANEPTNQDIIREIKDDSNWQEWCNKYINPYLLKGQYRLMIDEIGPNIIEFPLFTERFCKELIYLAEQYEWVTDRHEFFPTTDQTMEMLGMQDIYQKVLEEFVYPIWIWYWELDGEEWKTLRSENFIAKYDTLNQGSLDIHHDMSAITLNVRLNDEFKGGGTFIPRYKLTVQPHKVGWAMSHPGQITHKHGGRPVELGTRYILVSFTNK